MELAINIDLMSMMSAVGHTPSCNGENSAGSAVRWANRYCGLARWARRSHDLPTRTNHAKRLCPPYVRSLQRREFRGQKDVGLLGQELIRTAGRRPNAVRHRLRSQPLALVEARVGPNVHEP